MALVVAVMVVGGDTDVAAWAFRVSAGLLIALATLTVFTGARTPIVWFKVCPVLLSTSAALLLISSFV